MAENTPDDSSVEADDAFRESLQKASAAFHAGFDQWLVRAIAAHYAPEYESGPPRSAGDALMGPRITERARRQQWQVVDELALLCGQFITQDLWAWSLLLQRRGGLIDAIVSRVRSRAVETIADAYQHKWLVGLRRIDRNNNSADGAWARWFIGPPLEQEESTRVSWALYVEERVEFFLGALRVGLERELRRTPRRPTPTASVFRRVADGWQIAFGGQEERLEFDMKGLTLIRTLLENQGSDVSAIDLVADSAPTTTPELTDPSSAQAQAMTTRGLYPGEPSMDAEALAQCRSEIERLKDQIDRAEKTDNLDLAQSLDKEKSRIEDYVRSSVSVRGDVRLIDSDVERARKTAFERYRRACARLSASLPDLAFHLNASITSGNQFRYDPPHQLDWITR